MIETEIQKGERFSFGNNWRQFLLTLDEERIKRAEVSLQDMLNINLQGKSFLDVGSGSGLFSLAARRSGAIVTSFDYDPSSVWCTNELRRLYFKDDPQWTVHQGSVLDSEFLSQLERFDIVYSWGVLHHTGNLMKAMENVIPLVGAGGFLFLALYNDQGMLSQFWKIIKRTYNHLPQSLKPLLSLPIGAAQWGPKLFLDFIRMKPYASWRQYYYERGMSPWRDVIDWVGGYPFEVIKPKSVIDFYTRNGFNLHKFKPIVKGSGNNQYVFTTAKTD